MICRESWNTDKVPMGKEWAEENMRRENLPPSSYDLGSGDFRNLQEFPDNSFDVVVSDVAQSTYGLWNIELAMPEMIRVLKPSGKMVCVNSFFVN